MGGKVLVDGSFPPLRRQQGTLREAAEQLLGVLRRKVGFVKMIKWLIEGFCIVQ